jgi:hypothetical protein
MLVTPRAAFLAFSFLTLSVAPALARQQADSYLRPPIRYAEAPTTDPITKLQARIDSGELVLKRDRKQGYLASVLEALDIPRSSQLLVFSKTSFQAARISPRTPRAIYFNDDTYIGWVPGGDVVEVSSVDPNLGAVFYTLDQSPPEAGQKPLFERQTHACLSCHSSVRTENVPGHFMRSVFARPDGLPAYNGGSFDTTDASPLSERWGGWFVTGTVGKDQTHMGNVFATDRAHPEQIDRQAGSNLTDLSSLVKTSTFLEPSSDLVAHLVLGHQADMHNRLTAAGFAARQALAEQEAINRSQNFPPDTIWDSVRKRIEAPAEKVVEALLFCDAASWTGPVAGTSDFAQDFAARGPKDAKGRSLRDLDLNSRLFRYPCSFLIDSEAFRSLPDPTRTYIFRRLHEVLTGQDSSPRFAHLSPADRQAILEILRDTHHDLPDSWRTATATRSE